MILTEKPDRSRPRALRTALEIAVLTLLLLPSSASALTGAGSWQYSRDISISNPGAALSDYHELVGLMGVPVPEGIAYWNWESSVNNIIIFEKIVET